MIVLEAESCMKSEQELGFDTMAQPVVRMRVGFVVEAYRDLSLHSRNLSHLPRQWKGQSGRRWDTRCAVPTEAFPTGMLMLLLR